MAKVKKFGTFGGVFTPSILTILGVIMYLRLPWVVAQSGLYYTIAIIIIAHIVSITTGLSVSSIATDKKVKAGGNYYIISRSLGLPIGGTLGIALFVGLSFSISLYVIGFCESLLTVLEIPLDIDAIRLYGSITLLAITTVIFISTSLAIKTQYLILSAVILSLVSIFLGTAGEPTQAILQPASEEVDLFVIFGIFFPAVTGFTAGVQMSGDLKDPKNSIPLGTMLSIIVGFIVYIALAVYIAFNMDRTALLENPNLLVEMSWLPNLVVAGIWGATISSAMGSILGAPRILQATSADKVTPRFFEKGSGESNEPRRALLLTFIIAEAGILIGDLNVIARLVSIFFISTYGLINFSYAVELWASSDFRPSFKVPLWVGVVGAISSAIIMFELDVLAFAVATIVLGLIYLYLKRKELTLDSGDTWGSFWSSIVRSGLTRLSEAVIHKRNWTPNIILFRGNEEERTYLLNFSKWISARNGIISDFELIKRNNDIVHFSKSNQIVKKEQTAEGLFRRRFECTDIYAGIQTVAQVYGFTGVEPNTVVLGWPRETSSSARFVTLLQSLKALDHNVLLVDTSKKDPFGAKKTIDLWWRGGSNNVSLALTLMRFMQSSETWANSTLRLLIIVEDSALINKVQRNTNHLLEELRQKAEIKIINNAIEKRSFQEIMKVESAHTDLTIIGLPDFNNIDGAAFVENTNQFIRDLNSVLFLNASTVFEPYFIGIEHKPFKKNETEKVEIAPRTLEIHLTGNEAFAKKMQQIYAEIEQSIHTFYSINISEIEQELNQLSNDLKKLVQTNLDLLVKRVNTTEKVRLAKILSRIQSDILYNSWRLFTVFKTQKTEILEQHLAEAVDTLLKSWVTLLKNAPTTQRLYFKKEDISIKYNDPSGLKFFKSRKLFAHRFYKKEVQVDARLTPFFSFYFKDFLRNTLWMEVNKVGVMAYNHFSDLQKVLSRVQDMISNMHVKLNEPSVDLSAMVNQAQTQTEQLFKAHTIHAANLIQNSQNNFTQQNNIAFTEYVSLFDDIGANYNIKKLIKKSTPLSQAKFEGIQQQWVKNISWMIEFIGLELLTNIFKNRLNAIMQKWLNNMNTHLDENLFEYLEKIEKHFEDYKSQKKLATLKKRVSATLKMQPLARFTINEVASEVQEAIQELPEQVEVMSDYAFQKLQEEQFVEKEVVSVYLRRLAGYLVDTEFLTELNTHIQKFNSEVQKIVAEIKDSALLIDSALTNDGPQESIEEQGLNQQFISRALKRLKENKEQAQTLHQQLLEYTNGRLTSTFDKLNPYLITHGTQKLKQYIFSHEQRKVFSGLEETREKVTSFIKNMLLDIQYGRSKSVLMARKLNRMESYPESTVDNLITINRNNSIQPTVLNKLPKYYQQLFLGEQSISRQFLVNRNEAIEQAERIIKRYNDGYKGALLIHGMPRSGKTALSRMIASRHYNRQRVFRLNGIPGGSIEPDMFLEKLCECTNQTGTFDEVIEAMPNKSVLVLNDLELWWQRGENGFAVLDILFSLIDKYSHKLLFIINVNSFAYQLINSIEPIENSFLGIITCEELNAREIETAIIKRHRSTGIHFKIDGVHEQNFSEIKQASLFSALFTYTKGNIGVALQAWLALINNVQEEEIELRNVTRPELTILTTLDSRWIALITNLILHKQLTVSRISTLFNWEEKRTMRLVEAMLRSGIIQKGAGNALVLNAFTEHLYIEKLTEMQILWNN